MYSIRVHQIAAMNDINTAAGAHILSGLQTC